MSDTILREIEADLRASSEALQDLRGKYDKALSKVNNASVSANAELESLKTQGLEALESAKAQGLEALKNASSGIGARVDTLETKLNELNDFGKGFINNEKAFIIKVGNNADQGEIPTLREAINEALKYTPTLSSDKTTENAKKNKVVIEIQEGWEFREPLSLYNIDLSHVILTQKNPDAVIMCDFERENLHSDNGLLSKVYLHNASLSIDKLNLKAKARDLKLNNCGFSGFIYVRANSRLNAHTLKLDASILSTSDNGMLCHPFCIDDNSLYFGENFTLEGGASVGNGFWIADNSQAFTANISINGNCGHNGVFINTNSQTFTANISINGNCGHNGIRVDTIARWLNVGRLNFGANFRAGSGYKISLCWGAKAEIMNNGSHNAGAGNLCNINPNVWTQHGELIHY